MSTVSVVIPTHNRPELLKKAVASVERQTYRDFELIVVEDKESRGGGWARNQGIRQARGKYIAFLDDDDEWLPEKLELQMSALETAPDDVGFCFSAVTNQYDNREETTVVPEGIGNYFEQALYSFKTFLNVTLVIKRSVFDDVGIFDERFPSHQEIDLMIRITKKYRGIGINRPLVLVNMTPHDQVGSKLDRRIAGRKMIIKKYWREYLKRPRVLYFHCRQLAIWYRDLWWPKPRVKIILMDWGGYPLYREKVIGQKVITCGIGPLLENMKKYKAGFPVDVILVINDAKDRDTYRELQQKYPFIGQIIFRDNIGFDFGAYNAGWQCLKKANWGGDVVFMNSSARGPYHKRWLLLYSRLFHSSGVGLCGATLNSHRTNAQPKIFQPHVQSFFMYTSVTVLVKVFPGDLPASNLTNRGDIVLNGEIGFSRAILDAGYGIRCKLFKRFVYFNGKPWTIVAGDTRYKEKFEKFANKI